MNKKRFSKWVFLLLFCSFFSNTVLIAHADTESIYVDGYNSVNEEWDETGASPWLNDNTGNYISTSTDGNIHEEFTFDSPTGSGTINSVYLYIEIQGPSARNDYVVIDINDGSSWSLVAEQDPDDDAYSWYNFDVSGVLDTWTKITDAKIRVQYERSGSPATQTIYVRRSYLYVDYTPAGGNNDPVNDQCSISNLDDSDNIYAQKKTYTIDYDGHDDDGYADIDYVLVNITQDTTIRASFKYDEDSNLFSIIDGDDKYELISGSCSASRAGNNVNLTIAFQAEFDATAEASCELKAVIYDDEPASDTDTMQSNYCDIVTDILTNSIEGTDPDNPDRINIGGSLQIDFSVRYEDDPGSGSPSSSYPPDAEFTSISVYDEWDNVLGTDGTIENGAGSVTGTANATVQSTDYNLFLNMVDADYTDGEESPTEAVITDRILVFYQELDDTRTDINANIEFRTKAILEYDDHFLGSGDSLTANFGALSWDAVNTWFDEVHSESTVTDYTFLISSGSEATYSITEITTNQSNPLGIWDRILVFYQELDDTRTDINANIEFRAKAILEYDNHFLGVSDGLTANFGALSWDAGNEWFDEVHSEATVTDYTFQISSGNEATYSITEITTNQSNPLGIWDRILVFYQELDDTRTDINANIEFRTKAILEYDDHFLGAGDALTANFGALSWDAGNEWFDGLHSESTVTDYTFQISSGNEGSYGITEFTTNQSNPLGIWDRVEITLNVPDTRINTDTSASIGKSAVYAYDAGGHAGTITLNDTETKSAVGNITYTTLSITDSNYGLTVFTSNSVWCIFDKQQLQVLGTNNTTPATNEDVLIWVTSQSLFDNHVLGAGDTLVLKDTDSNTYSMSYNGSYWTWAGNWGSDGIITINNYDSVNEATYSITVLDMNGLSVVITVGTPPSGFTLNLRVIDSLNNSLSNINVLVQNSTYSFFDGTTNATGFIPEQTLNSGNYTITITKEEYVSQEYESVMVGNIYLINKLLTIEEVELLPFDTPLLVITGTATIFTLIGMLSNDSNKSGTGSVLGMLFWGASWGYWIIQHSTTELGYFAWIFVAPFSICIFNAWDAVFKEAEKGFGTTKW